MLVGAGVVVLWGVPFSLIFRWALAFGLGVIALWTFMSLAVSHWVYDRSGICEWQWIAATLGRKPERWVNIHAGFDESSPALHRMFPDTQGITADIFDAGEMTEPSIAAARARTGDVHGSIAANFRKLPFETGTLDAVFLLFAAHEIRREESRVVFLEEVRRILQANGRIVMAEHLRDWRNFAAFGPGFTHFLSRRTWLAAAWAAGLNVIGEFSMTPFVRVFVLGHAL